MNLHKLHRDLLTSQQQYDKIILDYDGIRQSKGESDITLDKPVTVYSVADKSSGGTGLNALRKCKGSEAITLGRAVKENKLKNEAL